MSVDQFSNNLQKWDTWREILSQPDIWQNFLPQILAMRDEMRGWITEMGVDEIWFSGAGTSAYIGDFLTAELQAHVPWVLRSVPSTDLVAAPHQFIGSRKPLIVNFGRSGNSAETIGVLKILEELAPNAPQLNITCNAQSALATRPARYQKTILLPECTHDLGFAMTSSYTTMMLSALGIFAPQIPDELPLKISQAMTAALTNYQQRAQSFQTPDRIVIIGSGALRFIAREAALKIMELTAGQIPVLWDSTLGFRHGPKSFVTPGTHIICFQSSDSYSAQYDCDLMDELKTQYENIALTAIESAGLDDRWGGVVQAVFAQILAVVLSERLGLNVDDPFAGQGTLTRVVSAVKLYGPAA